MFSFFVFLKSLLNVVFSITFKTFSHISTSAYLHIYYCILYYLSKYRFWKGKKWNKSFTMLFENYQHSLKLNYWKIICEKVLTKGEPPVLRY